MEDPESLEFAIDNFSEMMGYIAQENLNIWIHGNIAGEMWFGVEKEWFIKKGHGNLITNTPHKFWSQNGRTFQDFITLHLS